ncbi:hypothetical protein [Porticoccus sp.]
MTNNKITYKSIGTVAGILLCLVAMVAEAANLYRYRNSEGNLVIDHQVPPEYVAMGYEVITRTGRVEQVVPPQSASGDEDGGQVPAETVAEQLEEDQMLLRSYSTLAELKAAGDRRLEQLEREIEIIESNVSKNQKQLQEHRERAALHQFNGEKVPDTLLKAIEAVLVAQRDAEQMLTLRRNEHHDMALRYQRYGVRFVELTAKRPNEKR